MALGERDKRALIILGAIAGVVLVGFVVLKVLGGGGGGTAAAPVSTAPASSPVAAPTVTPSPSASPVHEAFNGRDPFSPPAALATQAADTGGGTTGGGGTTNPSGATSPPVVPTSPPPTGGGGGGGNNNGGGGGGDHHHNTKPGDTKKVGGKTVKLVAVRHPGGKKQAQILVDQTGYVLSPGQKFDTNFKLVSIQGQCTTIVYGDQKFTLCAKASNKKSPG